jgi:hypothetical protein
MHKLGSHWIQYIHEILYEHHLQGPQRILMKLCVCYVISAELSEGREWIPSACSQSKELSVKMAPIQRQNM